MVKFIIYTDGASRGNPGHAACGYVIQNGDGVIWVEDSSYLGITTNNVAEYMAVKMALKRLVDGFSSKLPASVEFRVDSLLVASQLSGKYKIKNPGLKVLAEEIKKLESLAGKVIYSHIPRAQNFLADRLANRALDGHLQGR